jgi:hypothetical protein
METETMSPDEYEYKLAEAMELIRYVLAGCSHKNASVYLSVAADYCNEAADVERAKARKEK